MTEPLIAGERLVPKAEPRRPREPKRAPERRQPGRQRARRRGRWLGRMLGRVLGVFLALLLLAVLVGGGAAWFAYQRFSAGLPDVDGLQHYQPRVMSRVYAGDSRLLLELATERRIFVPYTAVPDIVKHAFISAEDQNFFMHRGVDPEAILRAAITDARQYGQGKRPVGASTITQQVAKNMLLGNEMSLTRKVREALLAMRIEKTLSKEHILELYLNEIYLGQGAYGVAAAAEAYFNKPLDELSLAEAAFLAALPKAPNNYNPFRYPDAARARRDWVLDRMAEDRVITGEEAAAAKAAPVMATAFRRPDAIAGADYFAEEVRRELVDKFGPEQTTTGGLVVRTSLDPELQTAAEQALRDGLMRYDQRFGGWRGPVGHLEGGARLRANWAETLAGTARPPGMLADWKLGVVLEETASEATVGFLDVPPGATAPLPRVLPMLLADLGWARAVHDGRPGASPRRLADVAAVGDLVMAEPVAATPAQGKAPVRLERLLLRQIPQVQGALVSLDPNTGRVLALCGGWSFEMSQFNRATQAARQPGSSFKPMVYLTAMEQGISPSQRFLDAPFVLDMGAAGKWRPANYEPDFSGPVPLHVALEKSLNLVTVRVADRVGMDAVAATAIAFHMVDSMPHVLPAALGAVDTTVLREAGAYASLDAGGKEVVPTLIDSVQSRDGRLIWSPNGSLACAGCAVASRPPALTDQRKQIADADSVFQVVTMMQGVVQHGTGTAAGAGLGRAIAGKTGTSQDFNDAWFGGFTPDLVTVVWVGFDTPASLGNNETGGAVAAPIWHDYMAVALKNRPKLAFLPPPGVTLASYDSGSGTVMDAFKAGQEPGASGPVDGAPAAAADADASDTGTPQPAAAGVDSGLGGLY
jgi:penicillin-binding protein 1A